MIHFKCVAKIWRNLIVCVKILNIFWKVIKIVNLRANTDGKCQKCYFCGHFLTCTITLQSKAGDTQSSSHVSSCDVNAYSWNVRCELTLNFIAHIHTSVTLLTSRVLAWSPGRLMCQHASHVSAVAHISWDFTYVSNALQTLPFVSRNGGNGHWKSAPTDLFIWHQVTRL